VECAFLLGGGGYWARLPALSEQKHLSLSALAITRHHVAFVTTKLVWSPSLCYASAIRRSTVLHLYPAALPSSFIPLLVKHPQTAMATSTPEPTPVPGVLPGIAREALRSVLSVIPEQHSESSVAPIAPAVTAHRTELPVVHEEYLPWGSLHTASSKSLALPKAQDVEPGVPIIPIVPRRRRDALLPGFHDKGSFKGWIRHSWLDVVTPFLCVLVSGAIWLFARPILPQLFPLYRGIETSAWGLKYGRPYRLELITTLASALVSFVVPFLVIGMVGLWGVRRFWESNAAVSWIHTQNRLTSDMIKSALLTLDIALGTRLCACNDYSYCVCHQMDLRWSSPTLPRCLPA
jgi:hypothetical protein